MKHSRFTPMLLLLGLMLTGQAAFSQFSITTQLRSRAELRDGYQKLPSPGADPAFLISQRTRLSFCYDTKNLRIRFTPQDVRIWGDEARLSGGAGDNPSLDLLEAYAEIKMARQAWVSAGRQQLVYDSRHLLGDRNWNQNSIAYDALVFKFGFSDYKLHTGLVWNTSTDALSENPYPASRIKSLNFLWLNRKFSDRFRLSLLHISSGVTRTDTTSQLSFRHSSGLYGEYKHEKLNAWAGAYYQYGKNQKGFTVSAFMLDADASCTFGSLTPGTGIGILTGNSKIPGKNQTDHLFDPLYGNRHRFYGSMDYFTTPSTQTNQGGLMDYYLYLEYAFLKKTSFRNTFHYFRLAQTNATTARSHELGFENDLIITCRFSDCIHLEGGCCFFMPKQTLREIQQVPGDRSAAFVYLQLTLSPTFFKQTSQAEK